MPTVIPPNSTLLIFRWSVAGDPEEMVCTLGVQGNQAETARQQAEWAYDDAVATGSLTPVAAMNAPWTFVGVTAYKRISGDPEVGIHNEPITQGAGSQTALPSNCALLLKKMSIVPGRRGRGRMYLPSGLIEEGSVDTNGTISSATYTTIQNRLNIFFGELGVSGFEPQIFHSDGSAATPVIGFTLDTRIATQRQRMRR